MRRKLAAVLGALLVVGLVLPSAAPARPITVLGSLKITGDNAAPLTTQIAGFAVIANPGLEKTMVQVLQAPYVIPIFLDGEGNDHGPSLRLLRRNLDTTVVITNTTDAPLTIEITIYRANGTVLIGPTELNPPSLAAHETRTFQISDLLP